MTMHTGIRAASAAAVLALAAAPAAAQQGSWSEAIPASELREQYRSAEIYGVDFLNRHVGWAVGKSDVATMIFRTDDGGKTWQRLTLYDGSGPTNFRAVGFADANHGWIVGDRVLRTTDGGMSWEPIDVPQPGARYTANTVLVMGPDAVMVGSNSVNGRQIRVTTDGGRNWSVATVSPHGNDDVAALAFVPPSKFFAVTASAYLNRGGIYRSDDGGRTWRAVEEGDKPLHGIAFLDSNRGVAVGRERSYWTEDGGETWRHVVSAGTRYAAHVLDERTVIAVGESPTVLTSQDGGRTWAPGPSPATRGRLADLALVDPGWWFAAGAYGANALFHYTDPALSAPITAGGVELPRAVLARDGTMLPPGSYRVTLSHRGLDHSLALRLVEPAAGVRTGARDDHAGAEYACAPCETDFAVQVEYRKEDLPEGLDPRSFFELRLESGPEGDALVMEAPAMVPRGQDLALSAAGGQPGVRGAARPDPEAVYVLRLRHSLSPVVAASRERP